MGASHQLPMHTAAVPLLYAYPEAAARLGLTTQALRDLVYRGRGPAVVRLGRRTMFSAADLVAFVERHRVPPPPPANDSAPPKRRRGRPSKVEQIARRHLAGEG